MASLSLRGIYKKYPGGVVAVSDVNLEIRDKEFIVLVGPSGCGKSTTLRMIAGLEEISDGELYIDDRLVNDIPPAYPADKERLVLIGLTLTPNADPEDRVRRFCSELYPDRAANVALFIDGPAGTDAENQIKEILAQAGTHLIDEPYYVKCGIFGKKITLEERQHIVDWARHMQDVVISMNGAK